MKLRQPDQEFRNPKVFYPDPKNVDLNRVLQRFTNGLQTDIIP
jgi:hypothetical protein